MLGKSCREQWRCCLSLISCCRSSRPFLSFTKKSSSKTSKAPSLSIKQRKDALPLTTIEWLFKASIGFCIGTVLLISKSSSVLFFKGNISNSSCLTLHSRSTTITWICKGHSILIALLLSISSRIYSTLGLKWTRNSVCWPGSSASCSSSALLSSLKNCFVSAACLKT